MAVVQAWYDSTRNIGAPAAASYWAAFLDTRASLNAEARKAELAARSPEWLMKRLEQVRGQIAKLDAWKGSMELEALTARGDVAAGLSRAIGSVISAQLNAQGRIGAAQIEAQGRLSEQELKIAENARRALATDPKTAGRLASIQEDINASGLEGSETVSVYLAKLHQIESDNAGNKGAIDSARYQAWMQAVAAGHDDAAAVIAKNLGNDPNGYMRDHYGIVPEETMAGLRRQLQQYGGAGSGMDLLLGGLSSLLGVAPSAPGAPVSGGSIPGGSPGNSGPRAPAGVGGTPGAVPSSPAGFLSGLLTPPDFTGADARREQLQAEEAQVLQQLNAEMSRAPGGLSSRYTPNLLLAPVAYAPHKNQRVIDSVAAAHAADPLQVEAGFDAARLARSPRRAAAAAFRGGLAEAIPTGPAANTSRNFDAGETVYAWLADEADAILGELVSAKTIEQKAAALDRFEALVALPQRFPLVAEGDLGVFFQAMSSASEVARKTGDLQTEQLLIAQMVEATRDAAEARVGGEDDQHFGEIFAEQVGAIQKIQDPAERVKAAAALAQQTRALPPDLTGSTSDILVDALARAQAAGDLRLLDRELAYMGQTAGEVGADTYLRYAQIYQKAAPMDANATLGIRGAPDPIAPGLPPAQRDALPPRAPSKKDIYAAPGGVQVVERGKATGEILDLPDPAEALDVERLPPAAPRAPPPLTGGSPVTVPTNILSDGDLDRIIENLQRTPELGAQLDDDTARKLAAAARKRSQDEMRAVLRGATDLPFDLIPLFPADDDLLLNAAAGAP